MSLPMYRRLSDTSNPAVLRPTRGLGRPFARWAMLLLVTFAGVWFLLPTALDVLGIRPGPGRLYLPSYHDDFHLFDDPHPPPPPPPLPLPPVHEAAPAQPGAHKNNPERPFIPPLPSSWAEAADRVRDAFKHSWNGYMEYAAPHDELRPISQKENDNFNGWGVTIYDALDTMWIMGLEKEFKAALPIIAAQRFEMDEHQYAAFFETVIRHLGGLLSAYALSGEGMLLSRADDLGRALLPAFNTSSGMPMYSVNTESGKTKAGWMRNTILWAEALSCQLEYKYLAHLTGKKEYFEKADIPMAIMENADLGGFFPTKWNINGTPQNKQFSVGAFGDSALEYYLKQWLLSGKTDTRARDLYLETTDLVIRKLLYLSPSRFLLYVTDISGSPDEAEPSRDLEHLSCFFPGLLVLGIETLDLNDETKELHQWVAEGLTTTCWALYADQETGLAPDVVNMKRWAKVDSPKVKVQQGFQTGRWWEHLERWKAEGRQGGIPPGLKEPEIDPENRDYRMIRTAYLLRPETLESIYFMWRLTGDEKWRRRAWVIFQSIEKYAKTEVGYATVLTVDKLPPHLGDEMPSFFLAETLKYLYLTFSDDEVIPLDKYVLNTEAHPLPIFEWSDWEKEWYNISSSQY